MFVVTPRFAGVFGLVARCPGHGGWFPQGAGCSLRTVAATGLPCILITPSAQPSHVLGSIGTALDESVGDEVRVTVVATGLGQPEEPSAKQKVRLISTEPAPANATAGDASGSDYRRYEVPTIIRKQPGRAEPIQMFEEDTDYQKIPVFLRRQKD